MTRDDGAVLSVSGNMWEAALELAFQHGWRPAGTEAPRTASYRSRSPRPWDGQDYFSHDSQHVGTDDARALAGAVRLALARVSNPVAVARHSAAEGASRSRRSRCNALQRLVAFAHHGGFTIGRPI
jgi:hypothetical protein